MRGSGIQEVLHPDSCLSWEVVCDYRVEGDIRIGVKGHHNSVQAKVTHQVLRDYVARSRRRRVAGGAGDQFHSALGEVLHNVVAHRQVVCRERITGRVLGLNRAT